MRINCLSPSIFNKIAAGEVVERPASIVKELVENSIDAKASLITVAIENGGITKINVTDNGCGINYEDLRLAFLPHATSKIKNENDLFAIKTLGFRGEALASIGAVSEVTLISKEPTSEIGGKIEISGGSVVGNPTEIGCADGTDITVRNLFFNVPARAKFLKKPKTEEGEITSLMARFILANPMVSFKYIIDGKIKYLSSGKGILDALYIIYGKEVVENSLELDADYGYIKVYGYIGSPIISKPNRTYQTIIINNRVIENTTISSAVQNAYGEMLMKKQFPLFCLYIDLDYSKVDVNVHPNKKEVRFENGSDIYVKVYETVNRRLNSLDCTKNIETSTEFDKTEDVVPEVKEFTYSEPTAEVVLSSPTTTDIKPQVSYEAPKTSPISEEPKKSYSGSYSGGYSYSSPKPTIQLTDEQKKEQKTIFNAMGFLGANGDKLADGARIGSSLLDRLTDKQEAGEQLVLEHTTASSRVVGVVFNTYIIVEENDNVFFMDQHAGHERLLFDKLNKQIKLDAVETQALLLPYSFSVNNNEKEYIERIKGNLESVGFYLEEFGDSDYKVTTVPYLLSNINLKDFFNELLGDIKSSKEITLKDIFKDRIATMACKSAVKGGDPLKDDEIEKLLNSFKQGGNRLLCPHGRPVVIKIERKELERWFKRIV